MTKVLLTEKDGSTTPFQVKKISLFQFSKTVKTITDVLKMASENQAISDLIDNIMFAASAGDEEEADNVFKAQSMQAIITLLNETPEKAFDLLATLSGIEKDHLMKQDVETAFDVYDAILEVNDVEALITRAKKSLTATKQATKFMKKVQQSTEAATMKAQA